MEQSPPVLQTASAVRSRLKNTITWADEGWMALMVHPRRPRQRPKENRVVGLVKSPWRGLRFLLSVPPSSHGGLERAHALHELRNALLRAEGLLPGLGDCPAELRFVLDSVSDWRATGWDYRDLPVDGIRDLEAMTEVGVIRSENYDRLRLRLDHELQDEGVVRMVVGEQGLDILKMYDTSLDRPRAEAALVRDCLVELELSRARAERTRRAREQVRVERYVFVGVWTLTAGMSVAVLFALSAWLYHQNAATLVYLLARSSMAGAAGALGGALAASLQLRHAPLGDADAQRFRRSFYLQMTLGAVAGVVAMVLVEVGALPHIDGSEDVSLVALYAFLAGWSEPFLLGTLQRLAGGTSGDGETPSPRATDTEGRAKRRAH